MLEVCLDHVANTMSERVRGLEVESSLALEKLAQRVTAHHLDAVRRVKNHMVRLSTRVETIRSLLEKYLGDDDDLAELHLTGQRCALPRGTPTDDKSVSCARQGVALSFSAPALRR